MKKILSHFRPKKRDLFSIVSTCLAIFLFIYFQMPFDLLFMCSVFMFTIVLDFIYSLCE